ncbi:hypothetical protein QJS10_CPB11g01636 [Acorus calamus]|uniref:Uncharacterized protein n=1 Tax=Acorus calamus TaxID=4465 RepID=A0AAV9DRB2_ACOCL|nr:hypothetical protein QJS10_CPB11g01636 [Acorus calamus]
MTIFLRIRSLSLSLDLKIHIYIWYVCFLFEQDVDEMKKMPVGTDGGDGGPGQTQIHTDSRTGIVQGHPLLVLSTFRSLDCWQQPLSIKRRA